MQQVPAGNPSTVTVNLQLPAGAITGGTAPYNTLYNPTFITVGQTTPVTVTVIDSTNPQQVQLCIIQVTAAASKYF